MENASDKRVTQRLARLTDYQKTFNSDFGRRVLLDLMVEHKVISSTYIRGDALETAYLEGQRNVLLRIFSILKLKPEQIIKNIQEADEYARTI